MGQIFISYSRKDKDFVDKLVRDLENSGFSVWIDREDIRGGDSWRKSIVDAIRSCDIFVLVLSPNSVASVNVAKEVSIADSDKARIIPVIYQKCQISADMEYQLASVQQISMVEDYQHGLRQLTQAVGGKTEPPLPVPKHRPIMNLKIEVLIAIIAAVAIVIVALFGILPQYFKQEAATPSLAALTQTVSDSSMDISSGETPVRQINLIRFIVWVKPFGESAFTASGQDTSPDLNFPEKYVELVPDVSSDNGYRVEYYQPSRELNKDEQILLEWDVSGADELQITPLGEEVLPLQGTFPLFPKESENIILKAKSGLSTKLFVLPVKVFNGDAPVPPTIEFFQAEPKELVTAGAVEFSWSVSGEWTRIQLSNKTGIVADYLSPQDITSIQVSESSTYILTTWNGDFSSAKSVYITVKQ
jgi:hypothetical protein